MSAEAAASGPRPRQGRWKPLVRTVHIYASLLGLVLTLFFGATGFVLNNEDLFGLGTPIRRSTTGRLPAEVLKQLDPLSVVETVREDYAINGALVTWEPDEVELRLRFSRPGEDTDVVIQRRDGALTVDRELGGLLVALGDLHRGKRSGSLGKLVVDATAILLITISLTGFVLWLTLPKRRKAGLAALALTAGLLLIVGLYVFA
ncbi:MAG: PepSY-associated TM helix domain-containing protein [Planctomycetota bacterium]